MALPLLARVAAGSVGRSAIGGQAQSIAGSMSVNLSSNLTTVQKALDAFGRNQLPFATAMALNDAAFEVRKDTIERVWPSDVIVRKKNFMSAMLMPIRKENRATKRNLRAIVQNYPSGKRHKEYLQTLAEGGVKRPIDGRNITIPARDAALRNAQGAVPKSRRATAMLNRKNVFRIKAKKSGQELIVRRATKQRYPLQVLYLLTPDGKVRKQFDFYDEANSTARRSMARNFNKRFAQAKRSARR